MFGPVKKAYKSMKRILGHMSWPKLVIFALVLVGILSGFAIMVTAQPGFCNSCHIMNDYYDSWEDSAHHDVSCLSCHLNPGFGSYMRGKINGLSQAVDCVVGRIGTKANATVQDDSCLRSSCHNAEELKSKPVDFDGKKFTHDKHIGEVVDGINVTCGTCHAHFGGEEHFEVNPEICFSCHFLKSENTPEKLIKTDCLSCHEVPDKEINSGMVKVNHKDFLEYATSCEESCHKGQVEVESKVSEMACLNCHIHSMEEGVTSEELHAEHTGHEKVECYSCHGTISHGPDMSETVSTMTNCENCHSDTHGVQKSIFGAKKHPVTADDEMVTGSMFLTHVECADCHIEKVDSSSGLDSIGTVAKAVPKACDRCHKAGTGDQVVPYRQKVTKKLYQNLSDKIDAQSKRLETLTGSKADRVRSNIEKASEILKSIEADGSWGVHNFQYTGALLNKADKIISSEK